MVAERRNAGTVAAFHARAPSSAIAHRVRAVRAAARLPVWQFARTSHDMQFNFDSIKTSSTCGTFQRAKRTHFGAVLLLAGYLVRLAPGLLRVPFAVAKLLHGGEQLDGVCDMRAGY